MFYHGRVVSDAWYTFDSLIDFLFRFPFSCFLLPPRLFPPLWRHWIHLFTSLSDQHLSTVLLTLPHDSLLSIVLFRVQTISRMNRPFASFRLVSFFLFFSLSFFLFWHSGVFEYTRVQNGHGFVTVICFRGCRRINGTTA